jgi:integrase
MIDRPRLFSGRTTNCSTPAAEPPPEDQATTIQKKHIATTLRCGPMHVQSTLNETDSRCRRLHRVDLDTANQQPVSRGGTVRARPWKVVVPEDGNSLARETPIAPWAGELLQHCLTVRAEARIQRQLLLTSTRSGKSWGKESQYKCARAVLEEAGLDSAEGGSFRLHHTFAFRQLKRGFDEKTVAQWLGVDPLMMERYQREVSAPIDVV